ncbi:hypothetical protein [Nocardia tengchongensis]|uniref:hypothetical protein n=1 Tax=Nocardia tengchongensis TaxID=2055889 RepID=UPI0036780BFC
MDSIRPVMFGYLRLDLLGAVEHALVEQLMREFAGAEGFDLHEEAIYRDFGSDSGALRDLITQLAQRTSGHVVVPTQMHLDGVSCGSSSVPHQFSRMRVQARGLNRAENRAGQRRQHPDVVGRGDGVLGEFDLRVGAHATLIRVEVNAILARAGLVEMTEPVEAVVIAVADEARAATTYAIPVYVEMGGAPDLDNIHVQIARRAGELEIRIRESRDYVSASSTALPILHQLGKAGWMEDPQGGILTYCFLPLAEWVRPRYPAIGDLRTVREPQGRSWT